MITKEELYPITTSDLELGEVFYIEEKDGAIRRCKLEIDHIGAVKKYKRWLRNHSTNGTLFKKIEE